MENHPPPPLKQYRNIQIARWIINEGLGSASQMTFDETGRLTDFGMNISPLFKAGRLHDLGCPGRDGKVACNRPYGNERPRCHPEFSIHAGGGGYPRNQDAVGDMIDQLIQSPLSDLQARAFTIRKENFGNELTFSIPGVVSFTLMKSRFSQTASPPSV